MFSGDKQYDPEKRGRFSRGVKEFIGASDETVISSTGGGLQFTFDASYDEGREEYVVDASRELYPDARRDRGAVVYGTNAEWSYEDLEDVEDFVDQLWMPEDQDLYLEVYGTDAEEPVRDAVYIHDEPDAELERQYLPTLTVETGYSRRKNAVLRWRSRRRRRAAAGSTRWGCR